MINRRAGGIRGSKCNATISKQRIPKAEDKPLAIPIPLNPVTRQPKGSKPPSNLFGKENTQPAENQQEYLISTETTVESTFSKPIDDANRKKLFFTDSEEKRIVGDISSPYKTAALKGNAIVRKDTFRVNRYHQEVDKQTKEDLAFDERTSIIKVESTKDENDLKRQTFIPSQITGSKFKLPIISSPTSSESNESFSHTSSELIEESLSDNLVKGETSNFKS